jgi:hypothetical protein
MCDNDELRSKFLALKVSDRSPTGLIKADIYVSVRELLLEVASGPRPLIANWINPYAAFVYPPFPIIPAEEGMEPNAKSAYPNLIGALYECFIGLKDDAGVSIAYRPSVIMVDDPVLQYYFNLDLAGSGTEVVVVRQDKQLLQHEDKSFFMLLTPANHCWTNFRKGIIDFMKTEESKGAAATTKPEDDVPALIDEGAIPVVVTACMHCGVFRSRLHSCARCMVAQYCSRDCQVAGWKRHKAFCKKRAVDSAANAAAMNATSAAAIAAGAVIGAKQDAEEAAASSK